MSISEEGKGKLRAGKQTWPCSVLPKPDPSDKSLSFRDSELEVGLEETQTKAILLYSLSQVLYTITDKCQEGCCLPAKAINPSGATYI